MNVPFLTCLLASRPGQIMGMGYGNEKLWTYSGLGRDLICPGLLASARSQGQVQRSLTLYLNAFLPVQKGET